MGIYQTKPRFQRALQPVVAFSARAHVHPDAFTYGALALSALAGLALVAAGWHPAALWIAAPCMILRLGCNLLDGQLARATGVADALGEFKNEFGDRVADVLIFGGLLASGMAEPRLAGIALALVLTASYLGILSKALGGPRLYAGVFGKGDRMLSLAAVVLVAALGASATLTRSLFDLYVTGAAALSLITIAQRMRAIARRARGEHHV